MNRFFPQDAIWQNAETVTIDLMKMDGKWHLCFTVKGCISPSDTEELQKTNEAEDMLERDEGMQIPEIVCAMVNDLKRQEPGRRT